MVVSGTKKTSSISSITNQSTNGGPNKAGLVPRANRSAAATIAEKDTKQEMDRMKNPVDSTVNPSRPIWVRR